MASNVMLTWNARCDSAFVGYRHKLNGLEPYAWLKDTLEKLPVWPNSRIDELQPFKTELA
jgi:hypothetical protein